MSTATAPVGELLADILHKLPPGRTALIGDVEWSDYLALCGLRDHERIGLRLSFDQGRLEIMSPSFRHEKAGFHLAQMVVVLVEELELPMMAGGSTTFQKEELERGLEPDACFYIGNAAAVQDREEIDLSRDPPPDLAIEIDVSNSSLPKVPIYAALGVPEVWRVRGAHIEFLVRQEDGSYCAFERSLAFPRVRSSDLVQFLAMVPGRNDRERISRFRAWVRQTIVPPPANPG
jgi:Uma2 family endonuclease